MTPQQLFAVRTLSRCTFPAGSGQKRFIRNLASGAEHKPEHPLTPKQEIYLAKLFYSYRRQHGLLPVIEW